MGLVAARLETLIDGEREFMKRLNVILPTELTAATIADSDTSDEEFSEIEPEDLDEQ